MRVIRTLMLFFAVAVAAGGCAQAPMVGYQVAAAPQGIDNVIYGASPGYAAARSYGVAAAPAYAAPAPAPAYATVAAPGYGAAPAYGYAATATPAYGATPAAYSGYGGYPGGMVMAA